MGLAKEVKEVKEAPTIKPEAPATCPCWDTTTDETGRERDVCFRKMMFTEEQGGSYGTLSCHRPGGKGYISCAEFAQWYWQRLILAVAPAVARVIEKKSEQKNKGQRPGLSAKRRFFILSRDGFTCQYCGRTPADGVQLHVDHKLPVSAGGSDDDTNLITACNECNSGKSDSLLEGVRI